MNKILSLLLIVFSVGLIMPSCGESKAEKEARIRQAEIERQEKRKNSLYGTWELTDAVGRTWNIIIKDDNKVEVLTNGQPTKYGSIDPHHYYLNMSEEPKICFPNGSRGFWGYGIMNGEYLYYSTTAADAGDPNARLSITKTKW